jgi:hypothetical protein
VRALASTESRERHGVGSACASPWIRTGCGNLCSRHLYRLTDDPTNLGAETITGPKRSREAVLVNRPRKVLDDCRPLLRAEAELIGRRCFQLANDLTAIGRDCNDVLAGGALRFAAASNRR